VTQSRSEKIGVIHPRSEWREAR